MKSLAGSLACCRRNANFPSRSGERSLPAPETTLGESIQNPDRGHFGMDRFSLVLDLQFSLLLAVLTGVSVIVPYIGAALVTFPVAFVALVQWGFGPDFLLAVGLYLLLQALDGNMLVPWLFSEVVKLHPNAIILSILIFGGIWGLWGVFFAIPLATLAHAVIKAWPKHSPNEGDPALE